MARAGLSGLARAGLRGLAGGGLSGLSGLNGLRDRRPWQGLTGLADAGPPVRPG